MGRYKLVVEGTKMEPSDSVSSNAAVSSSNRKESSQDDGEILLDLSTPEEIPSTQTSTTLVNRNLEEIGIVGELTFVGSLFCVISFSSHFFYFSLQR